MSDKVTVLLLAMNHEKYIAQCLDSVFAQTYKNLEIIFLDNASADKTFETAQALLQKSGVPHKAFKNEVSKPITSNLNFMLAHATGAYIFPLSCDDWMAPTNIEVKMERLVQPGVAFVFGGGWWYYEDTDKYVEVDTSKFLRENMAVNLLVQPDSYFFVGPGYSHAAIREIGGWDETLIIEDLDLHLRLALKFKVDYVTQSLVYYRRHSTTFMSDYRKMHIGFSQYYEKHVGNPKLPVRHWMSNACKYFAYDAMMAKNYKDMVSFTFKAHRLKKDNGAFKALVPLTKMALLTHPVVKSVWTKVKRLTRPQK